MKVHITRALQAYKRAFKLIEREDDNSVFTNAVLHFASSPYEIEKLLESIVKYFTIDELTVLCFELGVDAEEFKQTKTAFVQGLITYLEKSLAVSRN